jgi:hypothetical protein
MVVPLGDDLRLALDRVAFAQAVGIAPDEWQQKLLRSDSSRILLNCCRQSGKSTMAALLALHRALYDEKAAKSLSLILSPTLRQSSELFQKVMHSYAALGRPIPTKVEQRSQVEFANGARIISLPGGDTGKVRGYSADLLVVDEAARVEDRLYHDIRPMLAVTGGSLIMLSTPRGRMGTFYEEWHYGEGWEKYQVTADEIDRISLAFLAEEKATLPPNIFRQEYYGEFLEAEDQFFSEEDIASIFDEDLEPYHTPSEATGDS